MDGHVLHMYLGVAEHHASNVQISLRTFFRNATSDPQMPTFFIWTRTESRCSWAGKGKSSNRRSSMPCKTAAGLPQVSTANAGRLLNHRRVDDKPGLGKSLGNITMSAYKPRTIRRYGIGLFIGLYYSFKHTFDFVVNQSIILMSWGPTGGQQTIKAYSENSNNNVYGSGVNITPCPTLKQIVYVQSIA